MNMNGKKLKGFIQNFEFPCIGAWDGFHAYINSKFHKHKLRNFSNLKQQYSVSNMTLDVGYSKLFLDLAVGAPGSSHGARFLRYAGLFQKMIAGREFTNKRVASGDYGEIPLGNMSDPVFPRFLWLVKSFSSDTGYKKGRNYNLIFKQHLSCDRECLQYTQK